MRAQGLDSVLSIQDSLHQRLVGVALDRRGQLRFLNAMIAETTGRRRESESATVFFAEDGRIERGDRRAYTSGTRRERATTGEAGCYQAIRWR